MRVLLIAALVAAAAASIMQEDGSGHLGVLITKDKPMMDLDVKSKEACIMKVMNHMLQPTMYADVRDVAREWVIEENVDKYVKMDVVKKFMMAYKMGLLPRGEVFVHTNMVMMEQAIKAFQLLMCAKDFDVFIKTACWMRERINGGMFVYAMTAAVFHRPDCRGVVIPAPYEIYPYLFVDGSVISKAKMMKMTHGAADPVVMNYYGIKNCDKNCVMVDCRKGVRTAMSKNDRMNYFTEDIDLNTYMYYLHMNYPYWMKDDTNVMKERMGEVKLYAYQQLLARMRLERLAHKMCDIKPLMFDKPLKSGYWPKLHLHTGVELPMRSNNMMVVNSQNIEMKRVIDDVERMIRDGVMTGRIMLRDGKEITLRKAEDIENLARVILGGIGINRDDAKVMHLMNMFKRLMSYNQYNLDKYTYVPTVLDHYTTCLRDPVFWKILKRVMNNVVLFKNMLPHYTRDELDFPGVKVESVMTDKLVTFMDEYDVDITNAMYLDQSELQKMRSDNMYVARMRRLNHHPFKVTIDVVSDKAVDAVVRVFLGPKFDCMGRLMDINDKRHDMVEIDSFVQKLDTGKNVIVRNSREMHGVLDDRPMMRRMWNQVFAANEMNVDRVVDNFWYKARHGFPRRLLLPLGTKGGMAMQMYVIVSPVRTGLTLPSIDMNAMKERRACRWTTCVDTMPLGFPFDRKIDMSCFFTSNMKFCDVAVFRKDLAVANSSKDVDTSDMVMRRDDLTYLDCDMLMRRSYKDVMLSTVNDNMMRM